MTRQSGYYWVKQTGSAWESAYWASRSKVWLIAGASGTWTDDNFDQINETRILAPDEVSYV